MIDADSPTARRASVSGKISALNFEAGSAQVAALPRHGSRQPDGSTLLLSTTVVSCVLVVAAAADANEDQLRTLRVF